MQADRELLGKAAKAAGIELQEWHQNGYYVALIPGRGLWGWDPLSDDGDALRLVVKLRLLVDVSVYRAKATDGLITEQVEPLKDDPFAATRRAIVRAAAALGGAS